MKYFSSHTWFSRMTAAALIPCHLGMVMADTVGVGGLTEGGPVRESFVPEFAMPPPMPAPLPPLAAVQVQASEAPLTLADLPSSQSSLAALRRVPVFGHQLCVLDEAAPWNATQAADFAALLLAYANAGGRGGVGNEALLDQYLSAQSESPFKMNIHLEKACLLWQQGRFVQARIAFRDAWEVGKVAVSPDATAVAETALGELLMVEARLGHRVELKSLLEEVQGRVLGRQGRVWADKAREILWFMENRAEQNVFCGFTALNEVCVPLGQPPAFPDVHDEAEQALFIARGISAFDLKEHSAEAGGAVKAVKRDVAGTAPPVPSVIHWNFGHFSAITESDAAGRLRVKDKHLKFDGWVEPAVILAEGSGFFLIPADAVIPVGYSEAGQEEAQAVRGRHCTHSRDLEDAARATSGGNQADCAMATYSFTLLDAGLQVQDTPIRYAPPRGYPTVFQVLYDMRQTANAFNPSVQSSSHFGPGWIHSYLSYVYRSTASSTATSLALVTSQGDILNYTYNTAQARYVPAQLTYPEITYISSGAGGPGYLLTNKDGSSLTFMVPDAASNPLRFFLKTMTDTFGNTTQLNYDASRRLTGIVDAMGQTTVVGYVGTARQIRTVTDPFGRQASFTYSSSADTGLLLSITDPMGIVSSFEYDANEAMKSLTTPYGKTTFQMGTSVLPAGSGRSSSKGGDFVQATDSVGNIERVEAVDLASLPLADSSLAPTSVSVGTGSVPFLPKNDNLYYRNTFQWDKKQMHDGKGPDYTKARVYNWLAKDNALVGVLGSIKEPLQGRTWFNYPGQVSESAPGTSSMPSKTVRQIEGPDGNPVWVMSQNLYANPYGLPTGSIDEKGRETRTTYHANNLDVHLVQVKDGATWRTLQSYDSYENRAPTQITDASGVLTSIDYNLQGQVLSTSVSKAGSPTLTTRYTYSDDVNSDSETDGYLIKVEQTDPTNASAFVQMSAYTYETAGAKRVKTATDERGYTVTYTSYDHFDRPLVVTHPDGTTEQFVYNRLELEATKARDGTWSRARYNHLRQLVLTQDSLGRTTSYDWCRCGQIKSLTDPLNRTTRYVRDIQGRVLEKVLPDNSKFVYQYQPQSGRLANMRTPKDAAAAQPTVAYKYDLDGRLLNQDYTAANTPDVNFAFADYLGRLTSHTDQLGTTNYTYHPLDGSTPSAGELASVNGPWADDTVFYEFDAYDRPKKQEIRNDAAPNVATHSVEMAYDALDRVTSIVNPLGTFNYAYSDVSDRVQSISTTAGGGFSQTFVYHPLTTPGAGGDMAGMTHAVGSSTVSGFGYGYDAGSRLRTLTEQLGPNPTTDTRQWAYDYTKEDELTDAVLTQPPGGTVQQRRSWQHDAAGNRARESIGNTSKLAWHNTRNQITQIGGGGQSLVEGTLDELGTATVKVNSGTHQAARMTSLPGGGARFQKEAEFQVGSNTIEVKATDTNNNTTTQNYTVSVDAVSDTFTHDANGNLETHTSGGVTKRYEWDAKNRLLSVQSADPPINGTTRSEFEYDGLDRRVRTIEKTHDGTTWTTQSNITWLWCGDDICQQRDNTGIAVTRSYYAEGMMVGSTPYLQTTDHLGSVRELLDGTTGALVARYDYAPWGTRTKLTGSGVDADFGFTGHLLHAVSGLILAKHRAYSAVLGRWISADPIGEEDDLNLYRYVGGSPTMDVDLLGLRSWAREALGFVPVIGSALDGIDAARCGHGWTAAAHFGMAIGEALGVGIGAKLAGKVLLKFAAKRAGKRIHTAAKKAFEYAVKNPRKADLNRMQLGKDAEVQATRWLRKWAERNGIQTGSGGLQFQVRGASSIPDVVFSPAKRIYDFKLTPKAVKRSQHANFQSDFPGHSITYIFGP